MNLNSLFAERFNVIVGVPADSQGSGGLAVPAISLKDALRATLVFIKATGTAGDDPTITFTQGDGLSSGALTNGKALAVVTRADTKRHATAIPKTYTAETQAAAATFTSATMAEEKGVVLIDITPDMLDTDNDFHCVRAAVADTGSAGAQLGVLAWIVEVKSAPPLDIESDQ